MSNLINDIRNTKDFRGITFSNFKKSDVNKELLNCILSNKLESALNWTAELICASHFIDLWDSILLIISKHIHLANIKLPSYILLRFNQFKEIIRDGYIGNEIALRNNSKIRQLFAEVIIVLVQSNKKPSFEKIKITPLSFDINNIAPLFKAPSVNYAKKVFKQKDPKELFIAINELAFHLSGKKKNLKEACYWIEWILEMESFCRTKKKQPLKSESRYFSPVEDKYRENPIWIIWELILNNSKDKLINKILNDLMELFSIKYTPSSNKKRRYILYFSIELLTESFDRNINIINDKSLIKDTLKKHDIIYNKIKKNEVAPKTDYLFNNSISQKSNLEKTLDKLDTLNKLKTY